VGRYSRILPSGETEVSSSGCSSCLCSLSAPTAAMNAPGVTSSGPRNASFDGVEVTIIELARVAPCRSAATDISNG
jgi:hypothetical protein